MHYSTYADLARPSGKTYSRLYDAACVVGFSFIIALSAQLALYLPFTPVPITGQTLAVLLTGSILGRKLGSMAVLLYLIEGIAGLPVFARGGAGIVHLFGPTGGYLVGFVAAAYVTGYFAERAWDRKIISTLMAMTVGTMIIFMVGVPWLAIFMGTENALQMGFYPFLIGAVVKISLAALIYPTGWKWLNRHNKK